MQYPPHLRIIRVMCSGMVNPELVVHALTQGADGVIIMGCHLGECHYLVGNLKTDARFEGTRVVLENCGVDAERFETVWVSSAEAPKFAENVVRFSEKIREMGPNPLRVQKVVNA